MNPITDVSWLNGTAALPHVGVIAVQGDDAMSFLQGQLTQDFALMKHAEARLAAFCSAKGRVQASFVAWLREPGLVLLVCSRDLLAPTLKRLSMFVLRAKVKLRDASAEFGLFGLAGEALIKTMNGLAASAYSVGSRHQLGLNDLVLLHPANGQARALWLCPVDAPQPVTNLEIDVWRWGEVLSGVVTVSAPIVDAFVPQMLNYESVGAVNFKKGCYPGQEVVARSQFRGILKRRAFIVLCDQAMNAADEVFHESDALQPCGLVAQAAPQPQEMGSGYAAIVSMQTSASQGGQLTLRSPLGAGLRVQPLPYLLLADV
jgi:tRNA-modifying protein YgfZ